MSDPSRQPPPETPVESPPEPKDVEHDAEVPSRPVTPPPEPDLADTALADLAKTAELTWKSARRWIIFVVGMSIVLFGLVVGILPGVPGIPIMFLGFALLATEFLWARKILKRLKQEALALKAKAERAMGLSPSTPPAESKSQPSDSRESPSEPPASAHKSPSGSRDHRGAA